MSSSALRLLRIAEIRGTTRALSFGGRFRPFASALAAVRKNRTLRRVFNFLLGYEGTFDSFASAQAAARRFIPSEHMHPDELRYHIAMAGELRESDYPALFFLTPGADRIRTVFDLGGNVGNLFFSYQPHLQLSDQAKWFVFDLPQKRWWCESLAERHRERRLAFTTSMEQAAGADVFIASGSMHYFERPLHEILRALPELPKRVLINRSPFSRGEDVITVQDGGSYLVPCVVYGRERFVEGMAALGYRICAEWPVFERNIRVPLYPDLVEPHYSGMYFELSANEERDGRLGRRARLAS